MAATRCRGPLSSTFIRQFHLSQPNFVRRSPRRKAVKGDGLTPEQAEGLLGLDGEDGDEGRNGNDDTTTVGHIMLRQERKQLYYLRLIEHEMPKLVSFRKPFLPPTSFTPVIIRSIYYGGEDHPATAKRSIVVPVARLPLIDHISIHKCKLLAGIRWTPDAPKDAGVGRNEPDGEHGYIKIACEKFPQPAMNLKWASDTLDQLVQEANETGEDKFRDVPLDMRHVHAKVRKAKDGGHAYGRGHSRPTIMDFPNDWLPQTTSSSAGIGYNKA